MPNNIRLLRKERGWSMRELGDLMGVHFSTVAKLEKSERKLTPEWVGRFAKAFGVHTWDVTDADAYGVPNWNEFALPVLELSNGKQWKDVRQEAKKYLPPADKVSEWSFYIEVDQDIPDDRFPKHSFVLVETEKRDLLDGHFYAVLVNNTHVRFVTYESSPARFLSCSNRSPETVLTLGHDPFVTMGEIIGVYIRMPSAGTNATD